MITKSYLNGQQTTLLSVLMLLRIKTSLLYSVCQLVLHQRACMLSW